MPMLPALLTQSLQAAQAAQAVATATASDPLGGHLVQGAAALILALQAWLIRAVTDVRDDVRMIRQTLFGVNNDNGMDGDVKNLKIRMVEVETYIEIRKAVDGPPDRRGDTEDRRHKP